MDITELVLQPRTVHDCRYVLGLVVFFQVVVLGLHQKQTHTHTHTHTHTQTHILFNLYFSNQAFLTFFFFFFL